MNPTALIKDEVESRARNSPGYTNLRIAFLRGVCRPTDKLPFSGEPGLTQTTARLPAKAASSWFIAPVSELCQNPSNWDPWRSVRAKSRFPKLLFFRESDQKKESKKTGFWCAKGKCTTLRSHWSVLIPNKDVLRRRIERPLDVH